MTDFKQSVATNRASLTSDDWLTGFYDTTGGGAYESTKVPFSTLTALIASYSSLPPGYIYGLTLSNGTDATNDIDIATGTCIDSTNAVSLVLGSILTKRLDASWAVGTNQGGLDTGSVADTTYHIWLIKRSDTGVVDALFSTSASSPTMPANYDYKRLIGSFVRVSGVNQQIVNDGDYFMLKTPVLDVAVTNPGTSAVTNTLASVPTGRRLRAKINVIITTSTGGNDLVYISDLSLTDSAPSPTAAPLAQLFVPSISSAGATTMDVFTNTSSQIRSRCGYGAGGNVLRIVTLGWIDTRGR